MSKFRVVNLIDKLFVTIAIFLIIYAWLNFYIRDLWITFVLSTIFSIAIVYVLFYFINKKQEKTKLNKKKMDEMNKNFLAFRLSTKKEKINLINKILSNNFETIVKNNKIMYSKDSETHTVIFATHIQSIKQEDLIILLEENEIKTDCVDIICNEYTHTINTNILSNLKISFIDKEKLFVDFFEKFNNFPDCSNLNVKELKFNYKDILKNLFVPQKAKQYFFCGLILIFSSLILPFTTYYIIFGSIFLICSIICKILPKFKK